MANYFANVRFLDWTFRLGRFSSSQRSRLGFSPFLKNCIIFFSHPVRQLQSFLRQACTRAELLCMEGMNISKTSVGVEDVNRFTLVEHSRQRVRPR